MPRIYNTIDILYLSFSLFDVKPSFDLTFFNLIISLYNTVYYMQFLFYLYILLICVYIFNLLLSYGL